MNGNHSHELGADEDILELGVPTPRAGLHRLAAVRQEKGVSHFVIAQRLGMSIDEVRLQEEAVDLSIGTLNHWAAALDVPVTDLVIEPEEWKHSTHLATAKAKRLLRVAAKLRDRTRRRSIQRLAQTFVEQLTEILPILDPGANKNHHSRPTKGRSLIAPPRSNGVPRTNGHAIDKLREPPEQS